VDKYPVTGELIGFCAEAGITGMDVELPTYDPPNVIPKGKRESSFDSCRKLIDVLLYRGKRVNHRIISRRVVFRRTKIKAAFEGGLVLFIESSQAQKSHVLRPT
jgi:hypothetical protein